MTEADLNEFVAGEGKTQATALGRATNIAGAVCTLALIVGVAVWGYRLAVRDAHGVPVIQAMEGPIRVAPDDPGGRVMAHTGLAVNRVAAEGRAAEVPERIVLAAPAVELAPEDGPGLGTAAPLAETEADVLARTLALAEELAKQAAADAPPAVAPITSAEATSADTTPIPPGGVQRSIRPAPRPAVATEIATRVQSDVPTAAVALSAPGPGAEEIAADSLPPGTRLAQIGAFDDEASARQAWDRIAERHAALFQDKARVIQSATSVGRTFYRLRVHGFASEDDSRRFCSAIESGDLRCIPVTMR